jgi:hypothetical protein
MAMHVADNLLYLAVDRSESDPTNPHAGMRVYDIGQPSEPQLVGAVDTAAGLDGLIVAGKRAYLRERRGYRPGAEYSELLVSISTSTAPRILGPVALPVNFQGAYVHRYRVLSAAQHGGMEAYDIGDPSHPQPLPGWDAPAGATDVAVGARYLLTPNGTARRGSVDDLVPILNRDGSTVPSVAARWHSGGASLAAIEGSIGVIAASWGVQTIDVSDPRNPAELGRLEQNWRASRLVLVGTTAYVNSAGGLYVVDLSDPASPALLGHTSYGRIKGCEAGGLAAEGCEAGGLAVEGCTALAALGRAGLAAVDVCTLSGPRLVGMLSPTELSSDELLVNDVAAQGGMAYVTANLRHRGYGRLLVVDVSRPESLRVVGVLDDADSYWAIDVAGHWAFVGSSIPQAGPGRPAWVRAIDVSDPSEPRMQQKVSAPGLPLRVVADDSDLYVAAGTSGLHVFRLLQPDTSLATLFLPVAHVVVDSGQAP